MPYIGKPPQLQGAYEKADSIDFMFTGTYSQFTIEVNGQPKPIGKATNLIVCLDKNGVKENRIMLETDADYTVSGNLITFSEPPNSNDHCFIIILGDVGSV